MSEPSNGGTIAWRLAKLEKTVEELDRKVDRLTMSIVGAALTFAISVGVFAITLLASGNP
jgi:hypothetical protein